MRVGVGPAFGGHRTPPGWSLLVLLVLLGCVSPVQWVSSRTAQRAPDDRLAEAFFSGPAFRGPRISPDGTRIVAIRSWGDRDEIVVFSGPDWGDRRTLVSVERGRSGIEASRGIRRLGWASDESVVYSIGTPLRSPEDGIPRVTGRGYRSSVYAQRGEGTRARKTRLYRADLDGETRYLARSWPDAPSSQFQDVIVDWLPDRPAHLAIAFDERLLRVNVRNGARKTIERSDSMRSEWYTDGHGVLRGYVDRSDRSRTERLRVRRSEDAEADFEAVAYDAQTDRFLDARLRVEFHGRLGRFLDRHIGANEPESRLRGGRSRPPASASGGTSSRPRAGHGRAERR